MRRFLTMALVALALASPAGAHKTYCGHGAIQWSVWSYGQQIYYREAFVAETSGPNNTHTHQYVTQSANALWVPWRYVHTHFRNCGDPA